MSCRVTDSNLPNKDVACCAVQEQAPRPLPGLRLPGQDHQVLGCWHRTLPLHSGQFTSCPPPLFCLCLSLSMSLSLCPCLCLSLFVPGSRCPCLCLYPCLCPFVFVPVSVRLSLFAPVSVFVRLSLFVHLCPFVTLRPDLFLLPVSVCLTPLGVREVRLQRQGCSYHNHIGKVAFILLMSDIYWH